MASLLNKRCMPIGNARKIPMAQPTTQAWSSARPDPTLDAVSMADYRTLGPIQHIAPSEFFAIAQAVPDDARRGDLRADVGTAMAESFEQAMRELERLCIDVGKCLLERGERVLDVEIERGAPLP